MRFFIGLILVKPSFSIRQRGVFLHFETQNEPSACRRLHRCAENILLLNVLFVDTNRIVLEEISTTENKGS